MVGRQYGWVTVISPEKRWSRKWNHCYVLTRCEGCGAAQWQDLNSLTSGRSRGCQVCSHPKQIPKWLERRLTAARQRCENQADPEYRNYGGRGIQFRFPSILEAGLYLMNEFGLPDRSMELDRIDTNGHYEPGNIRFATRAQNQANRRNTILSEFDQQYWPYARSVVVRKLSGGLTRDQIITDAERAVAEKRKRWRLISARLDFMTYEMPDRITVLPYRTASSTTAATAALSER
ncbi:MAG: hypothetical protein IK019_09955 [Clostridia bacterium]|nr:hypothetical protein [Clostridia bacterium]